MKSIGESYLAPVVVAALSALTVGCTGSTDQAGPPADPPQGVTHRDVCESLETLFVEKLHVTDVQAEPRSNSNSVDEPVSMSSGCEVVSKEDRTF